jgi:hypothetical protein
MVLFSSVTLPLLLTPPPVLFAAVFPLTVLRMSESGPVVMKIPPPPFAEAVFPLTVLSVSITSHP